MVVLIVKFTILVSNGCQNYRKIEEKKFHLLILSLKNDAKLTILDLIKIRAHFGFVNNEIVIGDESKLSIVQ